MSSEVAGSVGVFTTDRDLVVTAWDDWMAAATGVPAKDARGRRIDELYPELDARGITARMRRVLRQGIFEVLAPAFHKYVLPCAPRVPSRHFGRMRQFVTISPIRDGSTVAGVSVSIEDVTPRLEREREMLLQTGDRIAAGGAAPSSRSLVDALREHHSDPGVLNAVIAAITSSPDDLVGELTGLFSSAEADVRTYAALALGLLGDTRAVPALVASLGDEDANVRYHAIEALGRIGDRSAAEPLARIAETRDFFVAFAALDALAAIGEPSVAASLVPLLDEPMLLGPTATCLGAIGTEDVVVPMAALLGREGTPVGEVSRGLATLYDRLESATGEGKIVADLARGAIGSDGVHALWSAIEAAGDETELHAVVTVLGWLRHDGIDERLAALLSRAGMRLHVAEVLGGRGASAVPALIGAAPRLDSEGRKLVATALARTGSAEAVPYLIAELDSDPSVVIAAAAALGAIGDRRAFEPLLATLDHPHDAVRRAAVGALNSIGHPDMERAIAARLRDPSPRVRESAARIAGYFGYTSAYEAMLALATDEDEHVRRAVVEHLPNFDEPRAGQLTRDALARDPSPSVRAAAARGVSRIGSDDALRALLDACDDADMWVRYYATRALARADSPEPRIIEILGRLAGQDAAPPVRIAAIEALSASGHVPAVGLLEQLAREAEPEVAEAALRALGAFPVAWTRDLLGAALDATDPVRRNAALSAVARQRSDEWIPRLRELAASDDVAVRNTAITALRDIGTGPAVATLVQLAESMQLRPPVLAALSTLDVGQVAFLGDALAYENEGIRCMVVEALGRIRHPAGTSLLVGALDDPAPPVRLAATQALARVDVRGATGQLAYKAREMSTPRDAPVTD